MPPSERCPTCDRPLPTEKPDAPVRRSRFSVAVPPGEEGLLDDLLEQVVEKYDDVYDGPRSGESGWRYPALHWALYAVLTADLQPSEEGG